MEKRKKMVKVERVNALGGSEVWGLTDVTEKAGRMG